MLPAVLNKVKLVTFETKATQRGEILYSRGNISSGKTVYIELPYWYIYIRPDGVMD